jgi:hypothetical protein
MLLNGRHDIDRLEHTFVLRAASQGPRNGDPRPVSLSVQNRILCLGSACRGRRPSRTAYILGEPDCCNLAS